MHINYVSMHFYCYISQPSDVSPARDGIKNDHHHFPGKIERLTLVHTLESVADIELFYFIFPQVFELLINVKALAHKLNKYYILYVMSIIFSRPN